MAIYHLNTKTVSRSSGGTAANALAYESGVKLTSPVQEVDFAKKDVLATAIIGTKDDLQTLADKMELAENRKNSTVARRYTIALPEELSQAEQWETAKEFGEFLNKEFGVAVVANMHAPDKGGDDRNVHAHFTTTDRRVDKETGELGEKVRELTCMDRKKGVDNVPRAKANLKKIREGWADIANNALERGGHKERIDHRSNAERKIMATPQVHLGKAKVETQRRAERNKARGEGIVYQIGNAEQNRLTKEIYGHTRKESQGATERVGADEGAGDPKPKHNRDDERNLELVRGRNQKSESRAREFTDAIDRIGGLLERTQSAIPEAVRLGVRANQAEKKREQERKRSLFSVLTSAEKREELVNNITESLTYIRDKFKKGLPKKEALEKIGVIFTQCGKSFDHFFKKEAERVLNEIKDPNHFADYMVPKVKTQEELLKQAQRKEQRRGQGLGR